MILPLEENTPPALAAALQPDPDPTATVSNRQIHLTWEEAAAILELFRCQRQRKTIKGRVGMIAYLMRNGDFWEGSQITFALDAQGRMTLGDGQHRLEAAAQAQWSGSWDVRVMWKVPAERFYIKMDTAVSPRSNANVANAVVGYEHLSPRVRSQVLNVARWLNTWRTDYQMPELCSTPPVEHNIQMANGRLEALERVDQVINDPGATTRIRNRLKSAPVMAIMTETIHATGEEAAAYWTEVANTGQNPIARALAAILIEGKPRWAPGNYIARMAALAWNQRNNRGQLRREIHNPIRVDETNLVIPP